MGFYGIIYYLQGRIGILLAVVEWNIQIFSQEVIQQLGPCNNTHKNEQIDRTVHN